VSALRSGDQPRGQTGKSTGRITNRLVALSSAAVLTIYAAGYLRTRGAAAELQAAERPRVVIPPAPAAGPAIASSVVIREPTPTPVAAPPPEALARKPRATAPAAGSPSVSPTIATPTATPVSPAATSPAQSVEPPAATPASTPAATPPPQISYKDGTYTGWGTSRHGDIEATVTIAGGRITSALISQCWTRYSCSWVAHLQGQVVERQSPEVDYVSRATQSTNAFYYAVVQALSKAK